MFQLRLKALREEAHLSQAALAKKLGVAQSTVGMWESGRNKPENAKLEALVDLFNVSADYILGRDDKKQPDLKDDELRMQIFDRISNLSDPALVRTLDFLDGLLAGQETRSDKSVDRDE